MIDEKLKNKISDIEDYLGKWSELYFLKDGRVKPDADLWDTKEEAEKHIDYILGINHPGPITWAAAFDDGEVVLISRISYGIAMPVKD